MKKILTITLVSSVLFLVTTAKTLAKSVEKEIKETGVLKVGVRNDSPLFGYGKASIGYCADFAQELAKTLTEDLGRPVRVDLVNSTTQTRWDLVKDGKVHFECGPNSITQAREKEYNIKFSDPFFITATQIFIKAATTEEDVKTGTIGLISETTNEADMREIYDKQQIDNSYQRRGHGIADVQLGDITGFASDGILLIGTALAMQINPDSYIFVTPYKDGQPFCAQYGMILPGDADNQAWRDRLNAFIKTKGKGAEAWNNWFGNLLPYIDEVFAACPVVENDSQQ
jgi:polar amino acid transport system substrate-binding protein